MAHENLPAYIAYLEQELDHMRAHAEGKELTGLDADTAFELGYETAIFDLRHSVDEPLEVGVIEFPVPGATTAPEE